MKTLNAHANSAILARLAIVTLEGFELKIANDFFGSIDKFGDMGAAPCIYYV
jgi:hypothetical protein